MPYKILVPILVVGVVVVIVLISVNMRVAKYNRKKNEDELVLQDVLSIIQSCNTYPKMLTVFTDLESNIKKYNITVADNFSGYFKNE